MSDNPVLKIIEKAFGDNSLRHQLLSDMPGTLKKLGEKLSPDQLQELSRALDESGESFASELDQRLSQSGVSLNPQALLQQGKKKAVQKDERLEISADRQPMAGSVSQKESRGLEGMNQPEGQSEEYLPPDDDDPDYEVERD